MPCSTRAAFVRYARQVRISFSVQLHRLCKEVRDIEIIQGSAGHGELNALRAGIIFRHAARATQSTDRHFQLLSCR